MKKLWLFLVLVVATITNLSSQTYKEVQKRNGLEMNRLEKEIDKIKDRIFYLEVTLPEEIKESTGEKLKKLQQESYFAESDLSILKESKKELEVSLINMQENSLVAMEYRSETDIYSNLPEEMGPISYKRRVRAQIFKERSGAAGEVKKYPGLLVNLKQGLGELTTFNIYPWGMREVKPLVYILNPRERLMVDLAPGDYEVEIISGQYVGYLKINVDPAIIKHADGKSVYWSAIKLLSDH